MFGHAQIRRLLLIPVILAISAASAHADAGAYVDKSDATCWIDLPNGFAICEYSLSIFQNSPIGTSNVKILGKREIYLAETWDPESRDGERVGKYNTGLKSNANGKTVSQITVYYAEPLNGTVTPCWQKVIYVNGLQLIPHDTCTDQPVLTEDSASLSLCSAESTSEEPQQPASIEVASTQTSSDVVRIPPSEAGCYQPYPAHPEIVFCVWTGGSDDGHTTGSGLEMDSEKWLGKTEVYFGGTFDELTGAYNYDGQYKGQYGGSQTYNSNSQRSQMPWESSGFFMDDTTLQYCTQSDKEPGEPSLANRGQCTTVLELAQPVPVSEGLGSEPAPLDEIITALTEEYEARYLSGESESELAPIEKALTLLAQARDSAMSARVEGTGAEADVPAQPEGSAALQGSGESTPQ